jgi:glycerol uptake facilitator protein
VTSTPTLPARCFAEVLGTFLLVFFGCGAVHTDVLTSAQVGLWQVAIVWGVAIMAAVYTIGAISGGHINPAITAAMTIWRGFPLRDAAAYIASQVFGAFLAAAVLYGLFAPHLSAREAELGLTRGQPGSELTAMCYGEYFPSPGTWEKTWRETKSPPAETLVPMSAAFLAEVMGTLILALVVFAVTDTANTGRPPPGTAPVFIGLTVAILISVIAPLTQACFNPARDFGPRLFAYFAGWGDIAIPGPGGGLPFLTVYIIAPTLGAVLGGGLYTRMLHPDHAGLEASA